MSAIAAPMRLDISQTPRIPLSRLVKVELRKMTDTRAGMWLLIAIGAVTALVITIFGLAGHADERTFYNFLQYGGVPQSVLLPVLAILLITQEWSQRTGMVTFTIEPHRSKVLTAKVLAAVLICLAAFVVLVGVAALATVIFGGPDPYRGLGGIDFVKLGASQIAGLLQGLAFGLLLLNSAAAIVLYFVIPTAFSILFNTVPALENSAPWIDFGTAQTPLGDVGNLTGTEWAHLGVTATIWVIVPFVVGLWRVLRAEVK
jgi:ABC-2 type transport system permease protein